MPITEAWLKANHGKERDKVEELPDRDSMSVRVSAKGKIVYQLRYRFDGKAHRLDIGSYPLMSLKDARIESQRLRAMLEQGLNPKVERLVERQVHVRPDTLEDLFSKWYESYCIENKQSHDQIKRSFEIHVFNHIGQLPVARITLQQWLNILEPLSKKHPGIGLRVLINAKQMLKWAVKRQMIPVNVLAEMLAKEDFNIQKNVTTRTLTDEEIKLLWLAVDGSRMMHKNKLFIKLCMVYGCRNGELRIAEKKHFDFEKMVWTVPPENHKTGRVTKRPIIRPILPYTEQLIKEAMKLNEGPYLFMNDDGLNVMSRSSPLALPYNLMQWLRKNMGYEMEHWSVHDLRRTARTNFSSLTNPYVAEIMLGHALPRIQGTYDYYEYLDDQRQAYEKWIERLMQLVN